MNALLDLATAAAKMEVERAGNVSPEPSAERGGSYSRKTRPTHSSYQKAVMAQCARA